jgi:hypothetical protein
MLGLHFQIARLNNPMMSGATARVRVALLGQSPVGRATLPFHQNAEA